MPADAIEVDLHVASLDVGDALLGDLCRSLSADERAHADRVASEAERRRFIADHGHRRRMLAGWLGCEPAAVDYALGVHSKPVVVGDRMHFSASRAGAVALYAVSASAEVGVDVEPVSPDSELERLARRVLTPTERQAWERVAPSQRAAALAACWTRKEAHGKAVGTGLVFPLDEVEVWAGDDRPVRCGDVVVRAVDLGSVIARIARRRTGQDSEAGGALRAAVAVRVEPGRPISIAAPSLLDAPGEGG